MEHKLIRKKTRAIHIGKVKVGDLAPIIVQSMTCTDTRDVQATACQINVLADAGCEIVRVAVVDTVAAQAIAEIKKGITIPLIADIHFDYRLAIEAMKHGAHGIRINPGNIAKENLKEIIEIAKRDDIAIRIGINAGSLEKDLLEKYHKPTASALVESALRSVDFFEANGFRNLKLSLKSSDVLTTIESYRLIAKETDYPLHLGVTEAGSKIASAVKSSIGIGSLLQAGIGDTIRVSVTGDPLPEVEIAYSILRALGLRSVGVNIISCPTCGRCEIDLSALVAEVEKRLVGIKENFTVALMGCVVNGPGEASEADIGIAGGKGSGILFKKGKVIGKVMQNDFVETLMKHVDILRKEISAEATENSTPH